MKNFSIGFKKYSLNDQELDNDCSSAGKTTAHLYDKLIHESSKGFKTGVSSSSTSYQQILTVGKVPYFSSLDIKEGSVQPLIADVAMHFASKLKTALFQAAT